MASKSRLPRMSFIPLPSGSANHAAGSAKKRCTFAKCSGAVPCSNQCAGAEPFAYMRAQQKQHGAQGALSKGFTVIAATGKNRQCREKGTDATGARVTQDAEVCITQGALIKDGSSKCCCCFSKRGKSICSFFSWHAHPDTDPAPYTGRCSGGIHTGVAQGFPSPTCATCRRWCATTTSSVVSTACTIRPA